MVKIFNATEQAAIEDVIAKAEEKSNAEIAIMVAPISDHYQDFRFLYGFVVACIVILSLWFGHVTPNFLLLICIQCTVVGLFSWLPLLDRLCNFVVPKRILAHRTNQRAAAEFIALTHQLKTATPVVLIYLSIAERTVRILPSQNVREVLPDDIWEAHVEDIGHSIRNHGLAKACVRIIENAANQLIPYFPDDGGSNAMPNEIRHLKR